MGNWRTVLISGTMSVDHAEDLRWLLDTGESWESQHYREVWDSPYACLSYNRRRPGLAGLGDWPGAVVGDRIGNLAERDFDVEDVAKALEALVHHAPTMLLKVHCGGEWEDRECVATISVGEGLVVTGPPEIATLPEIPEGQIMFNMLKNLTR